MAQTLTETPRVSTTIDATPNAGSSRSSTQINRPQDEFEVETAENSSTAEDETQYPTGRTFQIILLSMSMVLIASDMDVSIVSVTIPAITDHFHSTRDIGWYSAAYRLSKCSFQFMFGKLYRMFSLKWIFLVSIAISLFGSVLCSAASTSAMLYV